MENTSGGENATTPFIFNNSTSYIPHGFNPETDTLVMGDSGLIWTHYYTVNEILEKLIPLFGLIFILVAYLSYTYIAPKTILYLKSKYGRNSNDDET